MVLMMVGGLATEFPTTAHDARRQVQGSEAFRGVDLKCQAGHQHDRLGTIGSAAICRHRKARRLFLAHVDTEPCGVTPG
jgi:hypothetical protein